MAIECPCSGCGQRLSVADDFAGRQARCPACGQIYTVPNPKEAPHEQPTTYEEAPAVTVNENEYWMRTVEGAEYGPVDRQKLTEWFEEGRIGQDYQVRQGANGVWQAAEVFRPKSNNPFAVDPASSQQSAAASYGAAYSNSSFRKPDPSGLVLSMGILAWLVSFACTFTCLPIGWIFALIAVIQGRSAIKDISNGVADPTNLSLVQVGYWMGFSNLIINLFGLVLVAGYFVLMLLA